MIGEWNNGTGRRKSSVARVFLKNCSMSLPLTVILIAKQPLVLTGNVEAFDIQVNVHGGGESGQAGAVRHGISKALTYFEPDLRSVLKRGGFLTRDPRVVERKKYGRAKARRSFQFSKR